MRGRIFFGALIATTIVFRLAIFVKIAHASCNLNISAVPVYHPACYDPTSTFNIFADNIVDPTTGNPYNGKMMVQIVSQQTGIGPSADADVANGTMNQSVILGPVGAGKHFVSIYGSLLFPICEQSITVVDSCAAAASSSQLEAYDPGCTPGSTDQVKTAIGCLPTDPQTFVNTALPWAIGLGSGLAFLLGLYGVFLIVVSAGNPEKMQAGRELITSAIAGLVIIVFAVFILDFIGVEVLQLFWF